MQRRIVIADDDLTILSLVSMRLGLAGFDVLSAESGPGALELIRKSEPIAAILDVRMPGGGMETLSALKADPYTSKLPVMMLTGERDSEMVMSAMDAGAADYMVKPFIPDRLLERVNRLVASSVMVWDKRNKAAPVWEL
jgi:DNA-binding response OmpR family regulator